jgi:hypothetical protein
MVKIRTKEQRQKEILPILKKMNELGLTINKHEELKDFFIQMKKYVQEEKDEEEGKKNVDINIPIEELGIRIKGVLAVNINERVWVKLEKI